MPEKRLTIKCEWSSLSDEELSSLGRLAGAHQDDCLKLCRWLSTAIADEQVRREVTRAGASWPHEPTILDLPTWESRELGDALYATLKMMTPGMAKDVSALLYTVHCYLVVYARFVLRGENAAALV